MAFLDIVKKVIRGPWAYTLTWHHNEYKKKIVWQYS